MLLLDASKAFDRIEYVRLFTLLRLRNMCPLVLRLIMNMYISKKMQVRFGTAMSSHFSISNGVKQGGVLSPILFTIYIHNLIVQLRKFNISCKIGNSFLGVFGYRWSRIKTGYLHFSNCSGESKNFRISLFFILFFLFHNIM